MKKTAGQVLKANNVNVQGQYHIDIGHGQVVRTPSRPTPSASSARQVHIVETCSDYAVIEITCSCGEKTLVKCVYDDTKAQ